MLALALVLPLGLVPACGDSVDTPVADEEPLRFGYVIGSTTFRASSSAAISPQPNGGPAVAGVDIGPTQATPGTQGKSGYVVRVDNRAYSIAVRLQGRTNGYWVARVNQVEAINAAQVSASLFFDVAPSVAPEVATTSRSAAWTETRHFGVRALAPLEIVPRFPSNAPAVITLRWDTGVDLDLQLRAPDGTSRARSGVSRRSASTATRSLRASTTAFTKRMSISSERRHPALMGFTSIRSASAAERARRTKCRSRVTACRRIASSAA